LIEAAQALKVILERVHKDIREHVKRGRRIILPLDHRFRRREKMECLRQSERRG
jgi:hypothetical protein